MDYLAQINMLTGDIASLQDDIRTNQENIERLEYAKRKLRKEQTYVGDYRRMVNEPDIPSPLANGKIVWQHAHLRRRTDQLYRAKYDEYDECIDAINRRISDLRWYVDDGRKVIHMKKDSIDELKIKQRKVEG